LSRQVDSDHSISTLDHMALERLQKIISRAGVASRRKAEELILQGKVKVNGRVVTTLGTQVDVTQDHIKVRDRLVRVSSPNKHYYCAYKPQQVITTLSDPKGRQSVKDLLEFNRIRVRVYPVGRLDWDAEGLLILTNDGELAHRIMYPRSHLLKHYRVKVMGHPAPAKLERLRRGIKLDGRRTLPARITVGKKSTQSTWLHVIIHEGRQNQLKKMFNRIGHPVCSICRTAIGPVRLTHLKRGEIRAMTSEEIRGLRKLCGM
jgi:23S rRNA pseudouridine2605 synthase